MLNDKFKTLKNYFPGLAISTAIASAAFLLTLGHVSLDPLVLSILISIIVGNLIVHKHQIESGISLSHRYIIPIGIVMYGTQVDFQPLRALGTSRILYILFMVAAALSAIYAVAQRIGIGKRTGLLLAAGSAVCGASAIMVLSTVIRAEREQTSISLLTITVVGLMGVIVYPLLQETFGLSEQTYALLCGSTLYQMGQVKAAASILSQTALDIAVPVKLLRVGTLLPIAIIYSALSAGTIRRPFIPWFIIGSVVVAVVMNTTPELNMLREAAAPYITLLFSIAIAAIGLSVDIEAIIDVGPKPLLVGFLGWIILIVLFIAGDILMR